MLPPQYVKPYVKRGKNDAADAEALCEAMSRPTMRSVPAWPSRRRAGGARSSSLRVFASVEQLFEQNAKPGGVEQAAHFALRDRGNGGGFLPVAGRC
jgi:transposase